MRKSLREWKQAKEYYESCEQLSETEILQQLENSDLDAAIQLKIRQLIEKRHDDFELIESKSIHQLLPKERPLIGKNIGGYQLIKELGSGGMSTVYLAKKIDSKIQKLVAIKILSPYATADKYLQLFKREQQSLAQLNHNNIVSLHHAGQTEDGTHYLVMDHIQQARDIYHFSLEQKLDISQIAELIQIAAQTLSYAHQQNIIHRDLKPANILIDGNGTMKIVDFGIALFAKDADNRDSTRVFTLDSASPEQIKGEKIDFRTDVFSLGALLLQLLTLQSPTPKTKPNHYNPTNVSKHVSRLLAQTQLKSDLKNIIQTAMHIDRNRRYKSMDDFDKDLCRYLNNEPVSASPDSYFYRSKKFLQRNILGSSLFGIIVLLVVVSALLSINNNAQLQSSENRNKQSLLIIDALFEQADPFLSGKNSKELVTLLEKIEKEKLTVLASDKKFADYFYEKMTLVYNQNGNYHKALESKRKQIQLLSSGNKIDQPRLFAKQSDELSLLHATGDYTQSISKAKTFLAKIAKYPEVDPALTLNAYTTLSKCYSTLNRTAENNLVLKQALNYLQEHSDLNTEFKADLLGSMAISYYKNNNKTLSNQLFDKTIQLNRTLPNRKKNLVANLRNYATANVNYGDFVKAENLYQESISIIKTIDPKHPTLASVYFRYSSLLARTNRLSKAKTLIEMAINILIESQDDVELFMAYQYLASIFLRENNMLDAIKSILLSHQHMQKQYSLDNSRMLKKFNLSMWILMIKPYQKHATEVLRFLNETDYSHSINTKEYKIFQVQKALISHSAVYNNHKLSLISQYLYDPKLGSNDNKIQWLQRHLELAKDTANHYPEIIKAYLHVWMLEFKDNNAIFSRYCQASSPWVNAQEFALKINLMQKCINYASRYNSKSPLKFNQILDSLKQQTKVQTIFDEFVNSLTNSNKTTHSL